MDAGGAMWDIISGTDSSSGSGSGSGRTGQAGRDRLLDTGAAAPQSAGIHREYQSGTADTGASTSIHHSTSSGVSVNARVRNDAHRPPAPAPVIPFPQGMLTWRRRTAFSHVRVRVHYFYYVASPPSPSCLPFLNLRYLSPSLHWRRALDDNNNNNKKKTSFCFAASSSSSRPIGHIAPDDASEGNVAPFGVSRPRPYPVTASATATATSTAPLQAVDLTSVHLASSHHLSHPFTHLSSYLDFTSPCQTFRISPSVSSQTGRFPETWFRFYNRLAGTFLFELYCTRSSITYRATIDKRPSRYPSAIPRSPPHVGKSQHL
ncbi:hypothetical protein CSOJ01_01922 [Colletotrichum sojae]|uniref:Uncharacterized protein n=1 Tax=Colletotrichum sojae TaxID=2175907 RepID=A0A8H6N3L7_9PEZI|nr:hypothetical protein CSOJ01_01922 [Colletotrichum sojae]